MTPYPDSPEDWPGGAPVRRRRDDPTFRARVAWSRLAESELATFGANQDSAATMASAPRKRR